MFVSLSICGAKIDNDPEVDNAYIKHLWKMLISCYMQYKHTYILHTCPVMYLLKAILATKLVTLADLVFYVLYIRQCFAPTCINTYTFNGVIQVQYIYIPPRPF